MLVSLVGSLSLISWSQKEVAEGSGWEIVWLKGLASELESEDPGTYSRLPALAVS